MANTLLATGRASALSLVLWIAGPASGQDFPSPAGDQLTIAHGKQVFSVNCGFCHGSDARGGEGGPNLLRSPIVLNDQKGELIAAIVLNGRVDKGMPKFNLPAAEIADIAAYVHSVGAGSVPPKLFDPQSVLIGNPVSGKKYFNGAGRCKSCHSVTQDFAGIGGRYGPKELTDLIFTGGATGLLGMPLPTAPPRTVNVKTMSGDVLSGRLVSIDDFVVVLTDSAGNRHTIPRDGGNPSVQVTDPNQAHLDMVRHWEDRDLHDVTAYLATLK